eukprot:g32348.t1
MEPGGLREVLTDYFALLSTKEEVMDNGKIREGYAEILGHVDIREEVVFVVMKIIKIDKYPWLDRIHPRILKEKVMKVIDEGRAADVIYIGFTKASDKVLYGRLVQKIKSHGIH